MAWSSVTVLCLWTSRRDVLGIGPGGLELGRSQKLRSQWRVLIRAHEPVVADILPEEAGSVKRTVGPKSALGPPTL